MRVMRRITQGALIAFVFLLSAPVSYACWCLQPNVEEAFNRAKVVFVGEVLEVTPPRDRESTLFVDTAYTVRFRVEKAWKEPFWTEANVLVPMDSCFGLLLLPQKGEKYLVYAEPVHGFDPSRNEVMTHGCTRTSRLSEISPATDVYYRNQAADDIRRLNIMSMFPPRSKAVFNPFRIRWPDN